MMASDQTEARMAARPRSVICRLQFLDPLSIYFSSVSHIHNQDREIGIADFVDDSIVADADTPCLTPDEFLGAGRSGIRGEASNR